MIKVIEELASHILAQDPGPVVRYRLLRDVVKVKADDPNMQRAKKGLETNRWVKELITEQREDGSWGTFHSKGSRPKGKIPSTEVGVERGLSLGLEASDPVLERACQYIRSIMQGEIPFPDRPERNDRWGTGIRLFLASTLSLVQPGDPLINTDRELWSAIAKRTFQSGEYNAEDEIQAHAALTGATVKDSYLVLSGKYQLNILGSIPGALPTDFEYALLKWLWGKPEGIGYLSVPLSNPPAGVRSGYVDRWLASLELLARGFPSWVEFAGESLDWLWEQRNELGYWDLGPRPTSIVNLPLSDTWRERRDRQFDWTTRILVLSRKYVDELAGNSMFLT